MPNSQDDESLVSWQSAFWGLLPLALNSMLQPAGSIAYFSLTRSFILRISPIICAADAISSLCLIACYMSIPGVSLGYAAKAWLLQRSANPRMPLEASPTLRLIAFILGTFSQSMKLFSCKGIPWTQAWAYLYVGSFVAMEVATLVARSIGDVEFQNSAPRELLNCCTNPVPPRFVRTVREIPITLARCSHVVFALWALFILIRLPATSKELGQYDQLASWPNLPWWRWLLVIPGFVYVIFVFIIAFVVMFASYPILALGGPNYTDRFLFWAYDEHIVDGAAFIVSILTLWVTVFLMAILVNYLKRQRLEHQHRPALKDEDSDIAFYLIITPVVTLLWYAERYNPAETLKPEWTNNLG
ncbi:hypothetical protein K458DRAFT_91953 [Lentithecium fluviatile CBS 122367]|uniref:Uncharacterized protein n=1 Tax=Lentithecium fluviatile CBS 122367 TaxID=1168545 RepID=A0A6G1IQJ0_9PLEO|nr:hypothetical protein K458DRAFT_91953 [Lentithecium fluviatile CBS 122367]